MRVLLSGEAWRDLWRLLVRVATVDLGDLADFLAGRLDRVNERIRERFGIDAPDR